MSFNLDSYRERLKIIEISKVNEESLSTIQVAQLKTIPFENIDCLMNLPIKMDIESLQDKLLHQKRGGYCFELNMLYRQALESVGFNVRPILARSMWRGANINARTHIFLLVEIKGKEFLGDAGFGGPGIFTPLPFEIGRVDQQRNGDFRLIKDETFGTVLQKKALTTDEWSNVYSFTLEKIFPADLEMSNYYTYSLPASYFRQNLVGALFTDHGRVTLLNNKFTRFDFSGSSEVTTILNTVDLTQILQRDFHLQVEAHTLKDYLR